MEREQVAADWFAGVLQDATETVVVPWEKDRMCLYGCVDGCRGKTFFGQVI